MEVKDWIGPVISAIIAVILFFFGWWKSRSLNKQAKEIEKELKIEQAKIDKELLRASGLVQKQSDALEKINALTINLKKACLHSSTPNQGPEYIKDDKRENDLIKRSDELRQCIEQYSYLFSTEFIDSFLVLDQIAYEIYLKMNKTRRHAKMNERNRYNNNPVFDETTTWEEAFSLARNEFNEQLELIREKMREISGL